MGQRWVFRSLEQQEERLPLLQIRARIKRVNLVLHSGIDHTLFSVKTGPWEVICVSTLMVEFELLMGTAPWPWCHY